MGWPPRLFKSKASLSARQALAPWEGESVDVDQFWAEAWRELNTRQHVLAKNLKLADARWTVDQNSGLIQFDRKDGALVTAPVQIIGSWNPSNETFTWGWNHPSVRTRLRAFAERTRWFGDKHGLPELTDANLRVSEAEAWRLTAVAMKVNAAKGAYRGPTDGPVIFMTMGDMKVSKRK
jgi:hypothetical protein